YPSIWFAICLCFLSDWLEEKDKPKIASFGSFQHF
ncbi:MAG: hypothetical protein ACJAWX_002311, partial [Algoriphagus sp.]